MEGSQQALNAGGQRPWEGTPPGSWETVAAGGVGGGGVSVPEGSPVCLEDWGFSERYGKGLRQLVWGKGES